MHDDLLLRLRVIDQDLVVAPVDDVETIALIALVDHHVTLRDLNSRHDLKNVLTLPRRKVDEEEIRLC